MENLKFAKTTEFTEELLLKLTEVYECGNPKPRNRAERRMQEKQNKRKRLVFNNQ